MILGEEKKHPNCAPQPQRLDFQVKDQDFHVENQPLKIQIKSRDFTFVHL